MASKAHPILVDESDSEIEIVSHRPAQSQARRRVDRSSSKKVPECIILSSSSDNEGPTPVSTPVSSGTVARTNTGKVAIPSRSQLTTIRSAVSCDVSIGHGGKKWEFDHDMDLQLSATIQSTTSNTALKASSSEDITMMDVLPFQHSSPPTKMESTPSEDEDDFDEDFEDIYEESYTIIDALNEYPSLNEFDVYERVAKGDINTPADIYHKIIKPQIEVDAAKVWERLAEELEQLAAKPRPLPVNHVRLMPQFPQPPEKPSLFANSTPDFVPRSLVALGHSHSASGRLLVPDVIRDWTYLRMVQRFRTASGAINQVSQSGNIIAVGSATLQGNNDDPPVPYNQGPSLIFWRDGFDWISADSHSRRFVNGERVEEDAMTGSEDCRKHYTVNDIKFDPRNPKRAISCASDGRLFAWDFEDDDDDNFSARQVGHVDLKTAPQELHYRGDSTLAVVADGSILVYKDTDFHSATPLRINIPTEHIATAVWGEEASHDYLFVTWQPDGSITSNPEYHKAFDVRSGKYAFRISDSLDPGNSIAISPDGKYVALNTYGAEGHRIGIHDVRQRCSKRISSLTVEGSKEDTIVEHMKFDPYGDYIAIGRADNFVQILDVRMHKVIHEFYHANSIAGPGVQTFGITGLCWITGWQGIGLRLFTGGDDGCVRMWDIRSNARNFRDAQSTPFGPGYDPLNGFEVAQEVNPIGHFDMGKTGKHDSQAMALVVGDQGGQVSVYDRKGSPYFLI